MSYVHSFQRRVMGSPVEFENVEKPFEKQIEELETERTEIVNRMTESLQKMEKVFEDQLESLVKNEDSMECKWGRETIQVEVSEYSEVDKKRDFEKYKDKGYDAYSRKEYKVAIDAFNRALELDPINADLILFRAKAKWGLSELENPPILIDLTRDIESILEKT